MVSNGARVGFLDILRVVIEFFFQQLFFYNFYGIFLWRGEREVLKAYVGCFSETEVQFLNGIQSNKKMLFMPNKNTRFLCFNSTLFAATIPNTF
jgi:hypothetical protein